MNTNQTPKSLADSFAALPESVRANCPARPGLPGTPAPSAESIRDWIVGIRAAVLDAAANTANFGIIVAGEGDVAAAVDLKREAGELLALASDFGDLLGLPRVA